MDKPFYSWEDFTSNFGKEMISADDVYATMKKSGLKDFTYSKFDYHFVSNDKKKLEDLNKFILGHYDYEFVEFTMFGDLHELRGLTNEIPITNDNLLYWALDMAKRGMEFDCKLDGYGSAPNNESPTLPDFSKEKEDYYFNKAIELYNRGDLSGSIFNWSIVLQINPNDPNSYYSRAIVKNELYTWKSAIRDYDKAIELAPDFSDAIVNRATVKDENGDYEGAIEDYNKAIALDANNSMAYFNRGNTNFNMGNKTRACEDWNKAHELGDETAAERIAANCRNSP
ncbi:hypothetical protein GCM10009122_49230 [Fulvivirga kasyanovii]|uniref:Tetratricopeptide repeat protein n=1 Tax=Fulvivirga kasyanovii TaxID=396812 RepID=A0ABW9RS13_9BACT|nr:tetratricopeptide repeat protein [Fulvivirga kasyanovii]MTI26088.1 tetratricopeptide repeat protein [Fulvivirga kasyanovii]